MKKHLLTLLFFIPLLSIAQSNYKKGYVVNLKGDTLRGYIDYKEWEHNPRNIHFKDALNNKPRQLGTNDINYFEISGLEYYERYSLKISTDAVDLANAPNGIDTSSRTDTVFLKILEKGKHVTLYAFNDAIKNRFFIKEHDILVPQELIYRVHLDSNKGNELIAENIYYRQLNALAIKQSPDPKGLIHQTKYLSYREPELVRFIAMVNGEGSNMKKKLKNIGRNRYFVGTGLNTSTLTYVGNGPFPNGSSSSSNSPLLTFGFDSFTNPNVGRLLFRVEMAFTRDDFTFANSTNTRIQEITKFNAAIIAQLIYNFYNTDNLKVFLGAGLSLNLSTYPTNDLTITNLSTTQTIHNFGVTQNFWAAAPIKAGIVLNKHFELYTTYIKPFGNMMTDLITYHIEQATYQFGVNFLLGKKK